MMCSSAKFQIQIKSALPNLNVSQRVIILAYEKTPRIFATCHILKKIKMTKLCTPSWSRHACAHPNQPDFFKI